MVQINILKKMECLKLLADLNKHKFISFGKGAPSPVYNPDWALKLGMHDGKKRKSIMKVNSVMGLLLAVESGVGLAALPEYLVSNSNKLSKCYRNLKAQLQKLILCILNP